MLVGYYYAAPLERGQRNYLNCDSLLFFSMFYEDYNFEWMDVVVSVVWNVD